MSNTDYTVDVEVTEDITPTVDTGDATSSSLDDEQIFLSAEINPEELIDADVNTNEMVDISVQEAVGSTETDHRLLTHRDAPEQHPMSAITGLNTSLQNMSASIDSRLTADENGIILLQVETNDHTQRLGVVEDDVVDAAKTATNYVTALSSSGIKLHAEDSASLDYIRLDGDGMEVFKGAESAAVFGDTTRIGFDAGAHLNLDGGGIVGVASNGTQYFSIREGVEGYIYTYDWIYTDKIVTATTKAYNLSNRNEVSAAVYQNYSSLSSGGEFRIQIEFYVTRRNRTGAANSITYCYATSNVAFTKGTSGTSDYVNYSGDTVSFRNRYPTIPTDDSTYYYEYVGRKFMFGASALGHFPFYRFGVDVAETGGASSFVMGIGTQADFQNQLAIGKYNSNFADALLMAGNGSSDASRSNALVLTNIGNLIISGTLTQSSDRRLKEHINYLGDDAVEFIGQLKPTHFIKDGAHHLGFYAQDVEAADKWHCMTGEMNGFKTLGYTELIAPLVAYCQSLEQRIEELERN